MAYLQARQRWIPNYRQWRIAQQERGGGPVEKANDLIVARRQKGRGMQWSLEASDALAAFFVSLNLSKQSLTLIAS